MYAAQWGDPYQQYYDPNVYISPYVPGAAPYGYRPESRAWWRIFQNVIANCFTGIVGRSPKYPQLFFLLAADTTRLQWDLRNPPSTSIQQTTFYTYRHTIVTANSAKKLRIISEKFPWTIDIDSQVPISCEMVWEALYQGLQQPIADSEWGMMCSMKKAVRERVEWAAKKRRAADPGDGEHLRRIDYLGEMTMFDGLSKNEEFTKLRLLPGTTGPDTWVVSLKT